MEKLSARMKKKDVNKKISARMKKKRNMKQLGWKKSEFPLDPLVCWPRGQCSEANPQMRLEHNVPLCPSTGDTC